MRSAAVLIAAVVAIFAGAATAHASSLVPMGEEIASSRLAGIEPGEHAASTARLGPPAAPAAQRAADACPDAAPVAHEAAPAPSTPDAGTEVRGPRLERSSGGKPAWRWKALLPGALK